MDNIPTTPREIKLHQIKERLAAAHSDPMTRSAAEIVLSGTASERSSSNRPVYRAECLECPWTFESREFPHEPGPARDSKREHERVYRHRAQTVYDIFGQLDESFSPGGVRT